MLLRLDAASRGMVTSHHVQEEAIYGFPSINARGHGGNGVVGLQRLDGMVAWRRTQCVILFAAVAFNVDFASHRRD